MNLLRLQEKFVTREGQNLQPWYVGWSVCQARLILMLIDLMPILSKEQEDLFEKTITSLKSGMHEIELANVNQTIASVKLTSDFCDAKFFLTF